MNKIKIIALFGESASGKDTIQKWVTANYDVNSIISCTTRPKRENEKDMIDYYFLSVEEFTKNLLTGVMLEATEFRGWFYGTPMWALNENKVNIGVFNIAGIEALLQDNRLEVIPIYISANDKTRLLRSLSREENPDCEEICRRFQTDKKDFSYIDFSYKVISNNDPGLNEKELRATFDNLIKQKIISKCIRKK